MRRLAGQVLRFGLIGVLGVAAYLGWFVALHGLGSQIASLLARLMVALPTSWLNARLTFRSRVAVHRAYAGGLAGLALGAALAAGTLFVMHRADARPSQVAELVALGLAQVVAALARFLVLRRVAVPADAQPASSLRPRRPESVREHLMYRRHRTTATGVRP